MSDILWRDTSGNVVIWLMNGAQVLQVAGVGNAPTVWSIASTGDYNSDGKSDILRRDASGNVAIWFMNGAQVSSSAGVGNPHRLFADVVVDGCGRQGSRTRIIGAPAIVTVQHAIILNDLSPSSSFF